MSVNLIISGPNFYTEKRFSKGISIGEFKKKLEFLTGIPSNYQTIYINQNQQRYIAFPLENSNLSEYDVLIGKYLFLDGLQLEIIDQRGSKQDNINNLKFKTNEINNLNNNELDNNIHKFEISEEAYQNRKDNVQNQMKALKLGKYASSNNDLKTITTSNSNKSEDELYEEFKSIYKIQERCEVELKGMSNKLRGQIQFFGKTKFQNGFWVGIQLDEPYGKNDGSVEGVRYFECLPKYGIFLRPEKVTVGDFPPIDDLFDDLDEL